MSNPLTESMRLVAQAEGQGEVAEQQTNGAKSGWRKAGEVATGVGIFAGLILVGRVVSDGYEVAKSWAADKAEERRNRKAQPAPAPAPAPEAETASS